MSDLFWWWLAVTVVLAAVSYWAGWHYGGAYGRHDGAMGERERWLERQRRAELRKLGPPPQVNPEPRHSTHVSRIGPTQTGHASPLDAAVARHPSNRRRVATTADTIAPVILLEPGAKAPMRPQPPRTSGAGTQTMPRLTDTGELRKLADDWIDRMRADDVEWRAQNGLHG